jgi:predicted pyridoxine 5'-phosphate oxidase superfamily flavin-nucleotide-binding protein
MSLRDAGFHEGELSAQSKAGVRREAARLEGMLGSANLTGGAQRFLSDRRLVVLTSTDASGRLWASPIMGDPGFLVGAGNRLRVAAVPVPGDPLAHLSAGQRVGAVAIDLATRRRLRVNGVLLDVSGDGFTVLVEEAFGNCPQYIQRRQITVVGESRGAGSAATATSWSDGPTEAILSSIRHADTFFLGTSHPARGADCSHRGGLPGFVRVEGGSLWWPDYSGNNMFTSLGNLAVDPAAALLFFDFEARSTIHLHGTALAEYEEVGGPRDDGNTGRRVRFRPDLAVVVERPGLVSTRVIPYEGNPTVLA